MWPNQWHILLSTIDNEVQQELEAHYHNLNRTLDKLQNKQQEGINPTTTSMVNNSTTEL